MKYPNRDLIFQYTHGPSGECVYKEKSSHEWDISQCATAYKIIQLRVNIINIAKLVIMKFLSLLSPV